MLIPCVACTGETHVSLLFPSLSPLFLLRHTLLRISFIAFVLRLATYSIFG